MWTENLKLILLHYYMITSQDFPDIESSEDSDRFIEGIWCLHHDPSTIVYTGTISHNRKTNDYTRPDPIFQTDDQLVYTIIYY